MDDSNSTSELQGDSHWAQIAQKHWLSKSKPVTRVQATVIKTDIWDALEKDGFSSSALRLLESLQLLEKYLWPGFNADSTNQHVLLVALLINIKRAANLPTWTIFDRPADFSFLFRRLLLLSLDTSLPDRIRTEVLVALIGAFQSLDSGLIRKECAPLVSIGIWENLHSEAARRHILDKNPQFKKAWKASAKRYDSADDESKGRQRFDRSWLYTLVLDFLDILYDTSRQSFYTRLYCDRFMELLTDLQSQFPTRRYVNTLLKDLNLLAAIKQSPLYHDEDSGLFRDFFVLLRHYTNFPIDDHTGRQLSRKEISEAHNERLAQLQRVALKHFNEKLKLLVLSNYGTIEQRAELSSLLEPLTTDELRDLALRCHFRVEYPPSAKISLDRRFLLEIILLAHENLPSYQDVVQNLSILPTETSLYEASFLRNESYDGSRPLAIPKLNLQYLNTGDFLWRSFILFRCESFYDVRRDMEAVVKRLQPKRDISTGQTRFAGSSRMALPITKPAIVEIVAPKIGEHVPAQVKAEIILDVSRMNDATRREWESLRTDDVIFLLAVQATERSKKLLADSTHSADGVDLPFKCMRAAEVMHVIDDNGRPLRLQSEQTNGYYRRPRQRRILVKLDAVSYQADAANVAKGKPDIYETLNVVVRRQSRENNFKPMLESIQKLATSDVSLPGWLQDVFLGLGDPAGASYQRLPNAFKKVDFRDTFLDWSHLIESLPDVSVKADSPEEDLTPPFVLETVQEQDDSNITRSSKRPRRGADSSKTGSKDQKEPAQAPDEQSTKAAPSAGTRSSRKRRRDEVDETTAAPDNEIVKVSSYEPPNMGPYPTDEPKLNAVRFTPAQIKAITSGTQPGLTIVVGPPGTGKTDVATQIINNLYHNFPNERTLLIAHSNQALNQLFQKIVALDIDERHLLRLGHGEEDLRLQNDASYTKHGRVESFLEIGANYLAEVTRLAASMDAPGAHGSSCETADYFNSVYVEPAWKIYWENAQRAVVRAEQVAESFPFHVYFSDAPQPLFPQTADKAQALEIARGCYRHIEKIFSELEDIRPFEVLRNTRDKANYLLIKEARIIAMTSTHAAIRRQEIANLGFHYDNVVMEEAAQITEIENFIPLAMQQSKDGELPLKRIVLAGDHLQNSPIIQNLAFRQYANLEQSLFLRLIRLGVPTVLLDQQGRARPSIAELYSWRYSGLGNLPIVQSLPEFEMANAGFQYDYQFIDVPDYKGKGETEPTPHFIQNLGEAEYAVALFMFMRLLGYPASKISILAMYAGQRALIRDVLGHRCAKNRLFGMPRIVTTVDKYQGEQNDYIILSLTRTSRIGYLRDIRRLTVALSRARLGLYILGRREVFEASLELKPAFDLLFQRPDKLKLVVGEMFPSQRPVAEETESTEMDGVEHLGQYVFEITQAKIASLKAGTESLPPPEPAQGVDDEDADAVDDDDDAAELDGDDDQPDGDANAAGEAAQDTAPISAAADV